MQHASASRMTTPAAVYADAADAAASLDPDRALFCFSPGVLAARARDFLALFPGDVCFAVKANPGERVIAMLADAGIACFDVASLAEIELIRRIAPHARLHYHNPVKSQAEIAAAYGEHGVRRFAVDHMRELDKIAAVTAGDPAVEIAVRFRLPGNRGALQDFSTKFGATPETAEALLRETARRGFKPILTFHPGSQCLDPAAYGEHLDMAARIAGAAGVEIAVLNVGGGFPAGYRAMTVPPLDAFCADIRQVAAQAFAGRPPRLEAEPGRALVADCVSLLTRVKLVKPESEEIYLNDGVYGALMELSQCPRLLPPYRVIGRDAPREAATRAFTVYGPTCDPADRLPGLIDLPEDIAEGDFIEFGLAGAYGAATATRFNGYGDIDTVIVNSTLTGTG